MAKKAPPKTSPLQKTGGGEAAKAQAHFADGLVTRREAVKKGTCDQKLPPGATHWIEGGGDEEKPKIKRGRFSLT